MTTETQINFEERVQWYVASADRQAAASKAKFLETVEKYGLPYALEWADGVAVDIYIRDLWMTVMAYVASDPGQMTTREALAEQVKHCTKQLISNYVHSQSTSAYANATAAEKAKAYARFVEQGQAVLDHG